MPPTFRFRDLWVVGIVVVAAVVLFLLLPQKTGGTATVRLSGQVTHTLPLDTDTTFTLTHNHVTLTVAVEKGKVQVKNSDCADKICQHSAPIDKSGQTIVCLPAACSITVEGTSTADAITY